jgi:ankyrin repeat protein
MADFGGDDPLAKLIWAIEFGNTSAALRLVRSGIPLDGLYARTAHKTSTWWTTPLIAAVMRREVEVLEALLECGANPNVLLPDGLTPLEHAARAGLETMVQTLIERGAVIEPRGDKLIGSGWPMLHCAASGGNLDVVKLLLENGADIFARDESGRTALDIAADSQPRSTWVAVYLRERMTTSQRPVGLQEAAADGLLERAVELLDAGTPVDAPEPVRQRTALHMAVLRERPKIAKLLIERGADVNARDAVGHVCVTLCRNPESVRCLKLLLEAGADPNSVGPDGLTPFLWHLRERSGLKILRILLDGGADVRARTLDGKNALELAPTDTAKVRRHIKDLLGVTLDAIDRLQDEAKQFPVLANQPRFQALAARLGSVFGRKPTPWKRQKGAVYFHQASLLKYPASLQGARVPQGPAQYPNLQLFVNVQEEVRAEGFTLVYTGLEPPGVRASLVLLPTASQYTALLAQGTNGANHGHSTRAIISWLVEMEKTNPFVLMGCGFDFLFGRFVSAVRDSEDLAGAMIAFCPDLDDGSPDATYRLAREVSEFRWLYFWWD